jgi:hypothetical protein
VSALKKAATVRKMRRGQTSAPSSAGDVLARSYIGLVNMATRFGFRLARSVRYLLEDKNGMLPFRSLEEVERKLGAMAQEQAKRRATVLQEDHPDDS